MSFTFLSRRGTFAQLIEMHNQQAYIGIASRRCEQSLNGLVAWFMSYLAVLVRIAFVACILQLASAYLQACLVMRLLYCLICVAFTLTHLLCSLLQALAYGAYGSNRATVH